VSAALLEVEGLHVSYDGSEAVRGIDLEVHSGEVVGIVGPNGAGKTTTLSAIFGLVRPAAGEIRCDGRSLVGRAPEQIAQLGLAFIPEGRHIFQALTVAENLRLGATVRRGRGADVERVLARFPILRDRYDEPAGRLSGGEQQQLAIGRALIAGPRLLLMDEPSLGLAPMMVELVFGIVDELRAQGLTVLLVEQNARRTIATADRTYVMGLGRVVAQGTAADLADRDDLQAAYLGIGATA
jgi:branched-chain amino acid transport system ATP-binding protein